MPIQVSMSLRRCVDSGSGCFLGVSDEDFGLAGALSGTELSGTGTVPGGGTNKPCRRRLCRSWLFPPPDVLPWDILTVCARPSDNHKRRYRSIRIPRAVYERMVRRFTM
jgi:hypothetical protein